MVNSFRANIFEEALEEDVRASKSKKVDADIFEIEPVSLETFVRDKQFLGLPPLSAKQFDAVEICSQIYFPETLSMLKWKKRRYVKEATLLWGKGSGKDFVSRIILLRMCYLMLCLRNPQGYFYHPEMRVGSERIDMLNTAANDTQAVNVFFSPLRKYVEKSPFFHNRAETLTHEVRFEKSIHLHSGHSEAEPMEGMNLIAVVLDEIASFKTDEEVEDLKKTRVRKNIPRSAASLYDFASTSVQTRFPKVGKVIMISFPRFEGDFITTKYAEGKNDPNVFVSFGSTFEINPTKKESDFEDMAKKNPDLYNCRILCKPGAAEDAFFKNKGLILKAFSSEIESPLDSETGKLKITFRSSGNKLYYGHVDLAKNRDSAAFCMVHAYDVERLLVHLDDDNKKVEVERPKMTMDILKYWNAIPGGQIDFDAILNFIIELEEGRGCSFGIITFDGYQSVQMMQALEKRGIPVDELSVDRSRDAYEALQDAIYEGYLSGYYDRHLVENELPYLVDVRGKKIDHRQGRGKDGSDALAGAVYNCVNSGDWGEFSFWVK